MSSLNQKVATIFLDRSVSSLAREVAFVLSHHAFTLASADNHARCYSNENKNYTTHIFDVANDDSKSHALCSGFSELKHYSGFGALWNIWWDKVSDLNQTQNTAKHVARNKDFWGVIEFWRLLIPHFRYATSSKNRCMWKRQLSIVRKSVVCREKTWWNNDDNINIRYSNCSYSSHIIKK